MEVYERRADAAAAAAAVPAAGRGGGSTLDELEESIRDPLAAARLEVQHLTKQQLRSLLKGSFDGNLLPGAAALRQDLEQRRQRYERVVHTLKDGGKPLCIVMARIERFIKILEEEEAVRAVQQQQWRQDEEAPPPPPQEQRQLGQHPSLPAGQEHAGGDQSKRWLDAALQNSAESLQARVAPVQNKQSYVPRQALHGDRDYSGLKESPVGQPQAARGAPNAAASKRRDRLLGVSHTGRGGQQQQQQQLGGRGRQQQQQQQRAAAPAACEMCFKPPLHGRALKHVTEKASKAQKWLCFSCLQLCGDAVEPVVDRNVQPTLAVSVARHQQGQAGSKQQQQQQQQQGMSRLQLKPVPSGQFHSQVAIAPHASLHPSGAAVVPGGRGQGQGLGRGKGKQARQGQQARRKRASDDDEYEPGDADLEQQARDASERRQPKGRGGWAAQGGNDSDDSNFITGAGTAVGWGRQPNTRRRGAASQRDLVDEGPIDLLSDDDPGTLSPGTKAALATAAAAEAEEARRPPNTRPTRSNAWRSTSERFKGLKCLYPAHGGPGSVEVTALDLARLDPDEFLNDTVIDFYLRWLQDQLDSEVARRCYFFNTFFFKKLTETEGGSLTPEVQAYADEAKMKGVKLQTLKNHQKLRKWTKDVDLFSKDFIFVPVHEALHWSLMVICHPGVVMTDVLLPSDQGPTSTASQGQQGPNVNLVPPGCQTPCILHLDSIKGSHNANNMANKLRMYLQFEWELKVRCGPSDCRPKQWAEAHPGQTRTWRPSHDFPHKALKVPKQDNHCDCGLFMCSYPEFLTYRLPPVINLKDISDLGNYNTSNRDLFEGTDHYYPGLLTEKWFPDSNPTALRYDMKRQILELMADQCNLRVPGTDEWKEGDQRAEEVKQELMALEHQLSRQPYLRPQFYEMDGQTCKQERQVALERRERQRQQDTADKQEARSKRQSGAAKRPEAPDRNTIAAATERRLAGGAPIGLASNLFRGIPAVTRQADSDGWADEGDFEARDLPNVKRLRRPEGAPAPGSAGDVAFGPQQAPQGADAKMDEEPFVELSDEEEEAEEEQQDVGVPAAGTQEPDDEFQVDLEPDSESIDLGAPYHGSPTAGQPQQAQQEPQQQAQKGRQRKHATQDRGGEEGVEGRWGRDDGGAEQPASPTRGAELPQQDGEADADADALPPARKRRKKARAQNVQQPGQRQQAQQQPGQPYGPQPQPGPAQEEEAVVLEATQDLAGAGFGAGGSVTTVDAGSGGLECEIVEEPQAVSSGRVRRKQQQRLAEPAPAAQLTAAAAAGGQSAGPATGTDQLGRTEKVDWDQVVEVVGVLWETEEGRPLADLRFFYRDQPERDYMLSVTFDSPDLADSVRDLRVWQARYAEELSRVHTDYGQIDRWEAEQQAQQAQQQQPPGGWLPEEDDDEDSSLGDIAHDSGLPLTAAPGLPRPPQQQQQQQHDQQQQQRPDQHRQQQDRQQQQHRQQHDHQQNQQQQQDEQPVPLGELSSQLTAEQVQGGLSWWAAKAEDLAMRELGKLHLHPSSGHSAVAVSGVPAALDGAAAPAAGAGRGQHGVEDLTHEDCEEGQPPLVQQPTQQASRPPGVQGGARKQEQRLLVPLGKQQQGTPRGGKRRGGNPKRNDAAATDSSATAQQLKQHAQQLLTHAQQAQQTQQQQAHHQTQQQQQQQQQGAQPPGRMQALQQECQAPFNQFLCAPQPAKPLPTAPAAALQGAPPAPFGGLGPAAQPHAQPFMHPTQRQAPTGRYSQPYKSLICAVPNTSVAGNGGAPAPGTGQQQVAAPPLPHREIGQPRQYDASMGARAAKVAAVAAAEVSAAEQDAAASQAVQKQHKQQQQQRRQQQQQQQPESRIDSAAVKRQGATMVAQMARAVEQKRNQTWPTKPETIDLTS